MGMNIIGRQGDGYRDDVQGLRGVSILLVLLYHLDSSLFSGGFIGVDVFFVISGYVITGSIIRRYYDGKFSVVDFYRRRIMRLFPALAVVLLVSSFFAYYLFSPIDLFRYGRFLIASAFSTANVVYWLDSNYFEAASSNNPLLHTWSLSVEEQFYIIWPLLLVFLLKKNLSTRFFLTVFLIAVSIFISVWQTKIDRSGAFFLPFSRVNEFGFGAILSLSGFALTGRMATVSGLVGMAFIVLSAIYFDDVMAFPGAWSLVPVLGGTLIILSRRGFANYVLANPILVALGAISYSLYLVHWPIIVFYKYWRFDELRPTDYLVMVAICLLSAGLLWKFVEERYRYHWGLPVVGSLNAFYASGVLILIIGSLGMISVRYDGLPSRLPEYLSMSPGQLVEERNRYWSKFNRNGREVLDGVGAPILLIGNSHMIDLFFALRLNGYPGKFEFIPTTHKCYNFIVPHKMRYSDVCREVEDKISDYSKWDNLKAVYLHDNWPVSSLKGLREVIKIIREKNRVVPIYIFGPKMTFSKKIPDLALRFKRLEGFDGFSMKYAHIQLKKELTQMLRNFVDESQDGNLYFVDVLRIQCGKDIDRCQTLSRDGFLYFDGGHFTSEGAQYFGDLLKQYEPELFL